MDGVEAGRGIQQLDDDVPSGRAGERLAAVGPAAAVIEAERQPGFELVEGLAALMCGAEKYMDGTRIAVSGFPRSTWVNQMS